MSQEGIPGTELARLQARLDSIQRLAASQLAVTRRKQRIGAILGAAICVISALALANVTRLTFQLDANALSQLGRGELERRLPEGRESATALLTSEAPDVVGAVVQGLIDAVPQLRVLVLSQLQEHGRELTSEFETRLVAELKSVIRESKERLDAEMPNVRPEEKVVRLASVVMEQFQGNMSEVIQALYPDYARQIEQVRVYLEHLQKSDETQLTAKERTHKEIIQTMLRITIREQSEDSLAG